MSCLRTYLPPPAQRAAVEDVAIIEAQMLGYHKRLDLWYARVWELHGLWLDPDGRMLRYQGTEVALTKREFQLLEFLLDHPHASSPRRRSSVRPGPTTRSSQRRCATMCGGCARSWLSLRFRLTWSTSPAVATHWFSAPPSHPVESMLLLLELPDSK